MRMRVPGWVIFLTLSGVCVTGVGGGWAGESPPPEVAGPDGRRAFNELAAYYKNNKQVPAYKQALQDLNRVSKARSKAAGTYLLALFKQMFADESNGRAPWKRTPFFGSRPVNDARRFRKVVARAFGKEARGEAALDAALWLIESEKDAGNQAAGIEALVQIKSPKAAGIFEKLLAQPHPNAAVAKRIVEEAGTRGLKDLSPAIRRLCGHYRTGVREAARAAAQKLGLPKPSAFKPEDAFSPWLTKQIKNMASMVITEIPAGAVWTRFTVSAEQPKGNAREFSGWLLGQKNGKYHVLDWFGIEHWLSKKQTQTAIRTLAEEAQGLLKIRHVGGREARQSLSRQGGLSAQFEPRFLSLPEVLVGAWSFTRGDKKSAAAVLFPRLDAMADDRWMAWVTRDLLGHHYFQTLLRAFSHDRDYPRALILARHLSKPIFKGYTYQGRAKKLAGQLAKRGEDFKTFTLPKPVEWVKIKKGKSRAERTKYLAERLRLLNCIQRSQPGNVNYRDPQYARAQSARTGAGTEVINPFNELSRMKLDPKDLPVLVPYLADENYMPTFSYWRRFHYKRTLHQVNWAVAYILNDAAKKNITELRTYTNLNESGKKKHIEKILAWCKANAGKTREQLPDERPKPKRSGSRIDAP